MYPKNTTCNLCYNIDIYGKRWKQKAKQLDSIIKYHFTYRKEVILHDR